jgi:hypothetical protein
MRSREALRTVALCGATLASVFFVGAASAQCTISQLTSTGPADVNAPLARGQSFVACSNGVITDIRWHNSASQPSTATSLTLEIAAGDPNFVVWVPTYTQVASIVTGTNTIHLTTPVAVVSGQSYTFLLRPGSGTLRPQANFGGNPYAGGQLKIWAAGNGFVFTDASSDLLFEVVIAGSVALEPVGWSAIKNLYRER